MRKLKGSSSKKKNRKQQKTLARMDKIRQKDNENLRDSINKKLKWAKDNLKSIKEEIHTLKVKLVNRQKVQIQLETIIPAFEELLGIPEKEKKNGSRT